MQRNFAVRLIDYATILVFPPTQGRAPYSIRKPGRVTKTPILQAFLTGGQAFYDRGRVRPGRWHNPRYGESLLFR